MSGTYSNHNCVITSHAGLLVFQSRNSDISLLSASLLSVNYITVYLPNSHNYDGICLYIEVFIYNY